MFTVGMLVNSSNKREHEKARNKKPVTIFPPEGKWGVEDFGRTIRFSGGTGGSDVANRL